MIYSNKPRRPTVPGNLNLSVSLSGEEEEEWEEEEWEEEE